MSPQRPDEILVADDDADNRLGYVTLLRDAGYRTREATDGLACLHAVTQRPPSLILLDVTMPGLDGLEVLRCLRAGAHRQVPVILVTGNRMDPASLGSGLELGAEEYLYKPVRAGELLARVGALLKLAAARRELEALKRDQTAMLVHDLKQPLAIIALRAEFIEDEEANGELKQSAHAIRDACRQMETLINGVLELSRVEAGQLTLARAPVALDELVREVAGEMRDLAEQRDIRLSVDAPRRLPGSELDRAKIIQVLQNLIGNALKFTPPGGRIELGLRSRAGEAVIAVEDSGPGFDGDAAELFDRWRQTNAGRAKGGSGLGLAIARAIVEAHGGRIGAGPRSDGTHGARLWFTLPLAAAAASG